MSDAMFGRTSDPASLLDERLLGELARARAAQQYRVRRTVEGVHAARIIVDGRPCINFCSNDYLGLAADPRVAEAARESLGRIGTGSGAAALISGYNAEHARLEEELADFLRRPRALLFSSGWAANLGVLRALLGRDDVLVADELNHASLIDGGRLSGAAYRRVHHGDLGDFARALQSVPDVESASTHGRLAMVVTDAVFSMDGDLADLSGLSRLCRQYRATLMVDDAHGFGLLGPGGRGAVAGASLGVDEVPVYVATLGKSLGCSGAFVAGSETLIEYLIQRARTWVFSTAPPPSMAAAARAALAILRSEPERRAVLAANLARFRAGAVQRGLRLGINGHLPETPTPIFPLVLGEEGNALELSRFLMARGYWVAAIRPPTVPPGTARLRITVTAAHGFAEIDGLLEAIQDGLATLDAPEAPALAATA